MKKKVMIKAWEIASESAVKFGGKASEYIGGAMKLAWKEVKGEGSRKLFGNKVLEYVVPFGKAEAVIVVKGFRFQEEHNQGAPLTITKKVAIRHEGKMLGRKFEGRFAKTSNGMTKVGEAACHGEETAEVINEKIDEAVEVIEKMYAEFEGRKFTSRAAKVKAKAEEVVAKAEKQKEILKEEELKVKAIRFDRIANESAEGYNPYVEMVSEEEYRAALKELA